MRLGIACATPSRLGLRLIILRTNRSQYWSKRQYMRLLGLCTIPIYSRMAQCLFNSRTVTGWNLFLSRFPSLLAKAFVRSTKRCKISSFHRSPRKSAGLRVPGGNTFASLFSFERLRIWLGRNRNISCRDDGSRRNCHVLPIAWVVRIINVFYFWGSIFFFLNVTSTNRPLRDSQCHH